MWSSRKLGYVAVAVVLVLCSSLLLGARADASRQEPRPVLRGQVFGDPSVVTTRLGSVVVSTGPRVLRGALRRGGRHWHWRSAALVRVPRWARQGAVWGPDLAHVTRHRWVLYFAAQVRGLGGSAHCIGAAVARSPYGRFHPVDRRPLVCQAGARAPRAWDQLRPRRMPRRGVIDPSYFRDRRGHGYLVYKTSGRPSSIRLLPLAHGGLGRRRHSHSVRLVRSRGIIENPMLVGHHGRYYLLTSEGDWSGCGYHETWRASRHLGRWSGRAHELLTRRSTHGVCGPGGADIAGRRGHKKVYFHGWVRGGRRAMYAARLAWRHGRPVIHGYARR
ncbi:MAG TPA: family 43 glycosylhydrolase [Nocardioides sp.]|nr:family 43 glycosylhydrolase [Nocardioides sp.]